MILHSQPRGRLRSLLSVAYAKEGTFQEAVIEYESIIQWDSTDAIAYD